MTPVLLAEAPAAPSLFEGMLPMVLMFVVIYFLILRPMSKQEKERKSRVSGLERGDEVQLAGGILGRISNPDAGNGVAIVEISDRVKIRVVRDQIHDRFDAKAAAERADKDKKDKDKGKDDSKSAQAKAS
ncbi:MAG: preprotein translocase subunit YajC [Nannocystaceae bacterium]